MRILGRLFRRDGNSIINPKQARSGLQRALQAPNLANRRLEHTSLEIIPDLALKQVQAVEAQVLLGVAAAGVLRRVVVSAQFRDEVGAVFGCVDCERLWDYEQRLCEFGNGELFPAAERRSKVFEVDVKSRLDCSASWHDTSRLECPLDDGERVMQCPLHLIEHVVVRASQDDTAAADDLCPSDENQLIVTDTFLRNLVCVSQIRCFVGLVSVQVGEGRNERTSCRFRDAS